MLRIVIMLFVLLGISVAKDVCLTHELRELQMRIERDADWIDREACIVEDLNDEP